MQICGQEVNIETLKAKTLELGALMEDPDVLSAIQAKVDEANAELANFKPEIPEVPSLQDALAELNAELSSEEFAEKLKGIKEDFGEAVEDLDEILNKANSKLNEFLEELPSSEDLTKLTDGSLVGEALAKFSADLAIAEAKLRKKLAIEGKPTVDPDDVCKDVPNLEVKIKEIDVQEIKQKIINGEPQVDGEGKPVTETVTVKKQVKTRVDLPEEPKVPKAVPVDPVPKPIQRQSLVDPASVADRHLARVGKVMVKVLREDTLRPLATNPDGSVRQQEYRQRTYAYVFFYYIEIAKQLGVKGNTTAEIQQNAIKRKMKAKWGVTAEVAEKWCPPKDRDLLYRQIGALYGSQPLPDGTYIVDQVSYKEALANYARLQPIS
jgi:predicted HAD superfamily Cof-like phosphohydrolase